MASQPVRIADHVELAPAQAPRHQDCEIGWVGIVANRKSGSGKGLRLVNRLVRALGRVSLAPRIAWTPEERSAIVLESNGDPACRGLVAVGGDGTVAAVVNERPRVPVGVLPAGTENLVAQHFGLTRDANSLAAIIAGGQSARVDLGLAGDRRFFAMAGFGFDGDVVTRHHRARLSSAGTLRTTHRIAYVEPVLRASFLYRFPAISVKVVEPGPVEILNGTTVFVFNLPRYALRLPFAPQACDNDGWLDLVVFRDPGAFRALYYLWKVFRGNHFDEPGVYHRRVKKIVITANHPIPVQLDGDPGGYVLPPSVVPVSNGEPSGSADAARAHDGAVRGPGQAATAWTVEIVPAAVDMFVSATRPHRHHRVPLAGDGVRR